MDAMVDDIAIPFSKGHSNFKFFKKRELACAVFSLVFGGADFQ
jgi:hypothetical protein